MLLESSRLPLVAQVVKNPTAMQETQVQSLGQEDPLEKGMATHSIFLPGKFRGQRSLVGYSPWGHKELDTTERLTLSFFHFHTKVCFPFCLKFFFQISMLRNNWQKLYIHVSCGFVIYAAFVMLRFVPSVPTLLRVFIIILNFVRSFFCIY